MRMLLAALVLLFSGCGAHRATPHETPTAQGARITGRGDLEPRLVARAILPALAFQPGPPSGASVTAENGATPPFPAQPIPGFSALVDAGGDSFWAMPDNGYGAKANSGDFLLRLYRIRPDFRTAEGRMLHLILEGALRDDPDPRRRAPVRPHRARRSPGRRGAAQEGLLIANDNNYPASDGRWIGRDRPDDVELVIVEVPGLR